MKKIKRHTVLSNPGFESSLKVLQTWSKRRNSKYSLILFFSLSDKLKGIANEIHSIFKEYERN